MGGTVPTPAPVVEVPPQPLPGPTLPPLGPWPELIPGGTPADLAAAQDRWLRLADLHERQARRAMDWAKEHLCASAQAEHSSALRVQAEAGQAQAAALRHHADAPEHESTVGMNARLSEAWEKHAQALQALAAAITPRGEVSGADAVIAAHVRGIADAVRAGQGGAGAGA